MVLFCLLSHVGVFCSETGQVQVIPELQCAMDVTLCESLDVLPESSCSGYLCFLETNECLLDMQDLPNVSHSVVK